MGTAGRAEPGTTPLFNRHSLSTCCLSDAGDSEMTTKGSLPSVCVGEGELLGPLPYMNRESPIHSFNVELLMPTGCRILHWAVRGDVTKT